MARQARDASRRLAELSAPQKSLCLRAMANALDERAVDLLAANQTDLDAAAQAGLSPALLDRLRLDRRRIAAMTRGLREISDLPDPVGRILDNRIRPNGLRLQKVSTPIGVIVVIYESRPNVTADAAGLCFKSGNATLLRGGKEALHSNRLITEILTEAGRRRVPSFPEHAIQLVPTTDRDAIPILLSLTEYIDLCMPRGGEGLIRAVTDCSKVPVIKHYKGVCHVYVDRAADLKMAERIVLNAKCQRPGVCNAMETLLLDRPIAAPFLVHLAPALAALSVEIRADIEASQLLAPPNAPPYPKLRTATEQDWYTEYNDLILNLRVVDTVAAAIAHVTQYGSAHSDAIVTSDEPTAQQFLARVDSAAVYWNASTRFTDGAEFGMGAEIGISTDKIGARGPMGLEELTSYKWIGFGTGQVRT